MDHLILRKLIEDGLVKEQNPSNLPPQILFFSGGSALTGLSAQLKKITPLSIHLISPFDSGGSTGKLRKAFNIPAFGDLRNRMVALMDEDARGYKEIAWLFKYRTAESDDKRKCLEEFNNLLEGNHLVFEKLPLLIKDYVIKNLIYFKNKFAREFDFCGASLGNILLTAVYFRNNKSLESMLKELYLLFPIRGIVRLTSTEDFQLFARLEDDTEVVGQHLITGKEVEPLCKKIVDLRLVKSLGEGVEVTCYLDKNNERYIKSADLICYPPGSFYSSIIANLLPKGAGKAVASTECNKVYVPNLGTDNEQYGMCLQESVETLIRYLRRDAGNSVETKTLLTHVLLDEDSSLYRGDLDTDFIQAHGIQVLKSRLVTGDRNTYYNPRLLAEALASLS
ncbi:GAK system CofD-like protein [Teredinibacter sp. KSP-S5-2]|uniref:GAK system CofD-like protein n=1 Tax=Teredinibacter sp. KSP-S5-2 TaxID=3034506 RepID=UPI00293434CF|nr:GAK system CofD-like protein [Teredinibacter sp. KSP-S5-2]WNO09266.1 GAK system CofD-like protein [Teredinibacter sp. KSP-S5-2]